MLTAIETLIVISLPWLGVIAAAVLLFVAVRAWRRHGHAYAATFLAVSVLLLFTLLMTMLETSLMRALVQTAENGEILVPYPPILHAIKALASFLCFCTAIIGCVQYCFFQLRPSASDIAN